MFMIPEDVSIYKYILWYQTDRFVSVYSSHYAVVLANIELFSVKKQVDVS